MAALSSPSTASRLVAPVAGMAATWLARKALRGGYHGVTGSEPPDATDPETSLREALLWAALTAAVVAIVQVVIDRVITQTATHVDESGSLHHG